MKKLLSLVIVAIMMFTLPSQVLAAEFDEFSTQTSTKFNSWAEEEIMPASSYYIMTTYYDTNFYSFSTAKNVYLESFCAQITYRCTLDNASSESIYLLITDLNGGGYDKRLTITADGNSHTMNLYLPAGNYTVQVFSSIGLLHTAFAVNFKGLA